jgi:hypothetical protein
MEPQTTQQHIDGAKTLLRNIENVENYAQTEGKQNVLPSNIQQTITGLREYVQFCDGHESFVGTALKHQSTTHHTAGKS